MIILVLTFITLFLAIFSPCLVILQKSEQAKEIDALQRQLQLQRTRIEAREDAMWRRNKQMIMD
jgi:hypothetical protein